MKRTYLHPLPLRIWHWLNAFLVVVLLITGAQLRIPGIASLRPNDPALMVHKYAGWAMAVSFVIWLVYGLVSDHLRRHYVMRRRDLKGVFSQARFYLFSIFKGEENPFLPSPEEIFNPLQKLAYGAIMGLLTPVLVVTGLLYSDILFFRKYILLWDIVGVLDAIHVIGAYVFALYLVVHVYMATLGRTAFSHIKAMIVGYEEEPGEPEEKGV
ncbi:MAG: cytochrome b/b6 domain-containing protein [Deltaproteobacteria bacterium]|nr:cytochrome b/b6 domain-containing protein [Deltaproteobacteria bacterium]